MSEKELFLGYIRAYNAKDVSGMLSFFGDDCVFENISAGKVTVRTQGKAELEALARKSADAFSSREQTVLTLTGGHGGMAAEIEYRGVLQADLTPDLKAGSRLELRGVSVFQFAAGKIVRLSDYS
jgi:ketosteroid isomerase-like protein